MNIKAIIALCGVAILTVSVNGNELTGCVAKQFVEHKTRGLIHCKFPQDFNSVYWYDVDNSDAKPVLMYDRTTKTGEGVITGEYDIHSNGTLIIRNVSLSHENVFKVICFRPRELFNTYQIEVIVTVTPEQGIPRIDNCTTGELCILQGIASRDKLTCTVHGAKPSITLSWSVKIGNVEKALHAHAMIKPSTVWNVTFHSTAVLDLANVTTGGLNLFICSSKLEQIDHRKYSKVLVDMLQANAVNDKTYTDVFRERDKRVELRCFSGKADYMYVWKKIVSHSIELVSYGVDFDMIVAKRLQERYEVKTDKTLYIASAQIEDEGKFICISSDGISHHVATMNLVVLVPPSPSYLIIEECTTGNCIITSNGTRSLTCSVTGVRPPLNLKWSAEEENSFTIKNQIQSSVETMGLYDTKSILYFDTSNIVCEDTVKVTCEATGAATQLFRSLTELRIKVVRNCTEESREREVNSTNQRKGTYKNYLLALLAFSLILIVTFIVVKIIWRKRRTPTTLQPGTEMDKQSLMKTVGFMVTKRNTADEMRKNFKKQIQTSYSETISNTTSGYYVPNRLNVLPFQKLRGKSTTSHIILLSFEEIFTDPEIKDKHVLIEGRSGIGKTALVLHIIENWLLREDDSPLKEYNMIIMLPLKNVKNMSLSSAIIKYLLPEDGGWKEETIQDICKTEKKVLAIFDDFDQYSELQNSEAEVNKMLCKKIRQNWKVIVLCKPMLYDKLLSKSVLKLQIKRFTSDQADQYVNIFFSDTEEDEKRENLKNIIHYNSLIENLCMTPIFLFMIASQFQKDDHQVSIHHNSQMLRFLVDVMSKDKDGEDILCKGSNNTLCVSQIVKIAKSGSWINDAYDQKLSGDIERFIDKGVLVDVNSKKKDEERQLQFSHDVYKNLCTAHYFINHCAVDQRQQFLQDIDIPSNSQLFIYTCGLCKDMETFSMIINHLLVNQRKECYPYHITDCIVECFNGSPREYHVKDLLQKVCEIEYTFNFKKMDSTDLRNAKIYLFNTCASSKLPIKILSLYSRTNKITKTQITIEGCQTPLNVPEKLKTFVMDDLNQKIKDTDVLYLVEQIDNISEIIIRSSMIPRNTTSRVFDILRKRERRSIFVIWITYKGVELHMISYLSEVFNCWLNSTEIMAVNLYRKTTEWKRLSVEERFPHEKEILKEIKKTGVNQFLEKRLRLSKEGVDALFRKLKRDLGTLRKIIYVWHNLYDSDSKENEEAHRAQFDELVDVLRDKIKKAKTGSEKMRSNPELQVADNEKESGNQTSPTPPVNKLRSFSTKLRDAFFEFQLEDPSEIT